jgi:hypothetical protein
VVPRIGVVAVKTTSRENEVILAVIHGKALFPNLVAGPRDGRLFSVFEMHWVDGYIVDETQFVDAVAELWR